MQTIKMNFDNNGIYELIEARKSEAEGGTQSAYIFSDKFGPYQTKDQAFAVVTQPADANQPPTVKYLNGRWLNGAQWDRANKALNALVDRWIRDHVAVVVISEQSKMLSVVAPGRGRATGRNINRSKHEGR